MECLLPFGAESCVFQYATKKHKDLDTENYILPDVLYGCEAWSLTFREERSLRVFESRGLV